MLARKERWPPPEPISAVGRASAWTVAACLLVAGVATVAFAWNELTCTAPVGRGVVRLAPARLCQVLTGIGGISVLIGAGAAVGGAIIAFRTWQRPVTPTGGSGWRFALGVLFVIGAVIIVTRFPNYTCPEGVHLSAPFKLCIDLEAKDRYDATSWIWLKLVATAGVIAIGVLIVAVRKLAIVAIVATVAAWAVGVGWLLVETIGREYG